MGLTTNIITFSIIIILVYYIYKIMTRASYTGSQQSATSETKIDCTTSGNSTYSLWIYIDKWSEKSKPIFSRGDFSLNIADKVNFLTIEMPSETMKQILSTYENYDLNKDQYYTTTNTPYYYSSQENCEKICSSDDSCLGFNYYSSPSITTTQVTNTLPASDKHGCILLKDLTGITSTNTSPNTALYSKIKKNTTEFVIDNAYIPLQEWVFITLNVTNFYIEVYINGKLVRTIAMSGTQTNATGGVLLTPSPGFNGLTSDFKCIKTPLTSIQIWNNYRAGFGKYFSLSDYSIKIKFNEEND
uniref:Apple domain-containing protein n=1 Tax=viral metagenome TaxID=1070528 RepID=A0A6C0HS64_9ZZZZ